jgi:hypothetical protein
VLESLFVPLRSHSVKVNHGCAVAVHGSRGGEVKTEQRGCRLDTRLDGRHLAASQQIIQERRTISKTTAKTTVFDKSKITDALCKLMVFVK